MDPGADLAAYRLEQQIARRTRRAWEAALGGRSSLPSPMGRDRTGGGGGVPQAPIVVGTPPSAALLLVSATADSIASGGDYVTADAILYRHGFAGSTSPGASIVWPSDAIGEIQVEYAWDTYTGAVTVEVEVDGVVPAWGLIFDAVSGAAGVKRRGVHIAAGAEVKILVTQASGSAKTGDFVVEFIIPGPATADVEDPPPSAITDGFDLGWPVGVSTTTSIDGRITETGGRIWQQDDGSTLAIFVASSVSGIDPTIPPPSNGWPTATVEAGFSDGTIYAEVDPIGESNSPAFRNGIIFRLVDEENFWLWSNYRSPVSGDLYFLQSYVAGVLDYNSGALSTGARSTGGPIPLEVILDGDSIDAYYDGVLRQSITNSALQTATRHGVTTFGYGVRYFSATPP